MRQITFTLLFCLSGYFISAQVALDWAKIFGSSNNKGETGYSILTDASGNVYTAGYYQGPTDFDPGPGVYNLTVTAGSTALFVSKLDANGNFIWAKGIDGGAGFINAYSMTSDPSGNLLITGAFQSTLDFNPGAGTYTVASHGTSGDAYVLKLDANGNFIWAKNFGGTLSNVNGFCVTTDGAGNVYSVGGFNGSVSDFDPGPGTFTMSSFGGGDVYISKLNSTGNFVWAKLVGGTNYDDARSIQCSGARIYVAGEFTGTADFDPSPATYTLSSPSINQGFILKLDTAGNFIWVNPFSGTGSVNMINMQVKAGYIYNTGYFYNTVDFDPGPGTYTLTVAGNSDGFVTKLDTAGNFYWARSIGGTSQDIGFAISSDNSGNVFATGEFQGTCDLDPGPGTYTVSTSASSELYLTMLNAAGNFIWGKTVPTTNNSRPYGLDIDASGTIYCTGFHIGVCDYDPTPATYTLGVGFSNDAFIFKWSPCTLPSAPGSISGNSSVCSASGLNYSIAPVSGATSYSWTLPSISWSGTSTTNTINLTSGSTSGNLSVIATNTCGSSSASVLSITVNPNPTLSVNSGSICPGQSFTITPSGASTYSYTCGSAVQTPATSMICYVSGTSSLGCVSPFVPSNITVNSLPAIGIITPSTVCEAQSLILPVAGTCITFSWIAGPCVSNPTAAAVSTVASAACSGSYAVIGTDANGCSNTATTSVFVSPLPILVPVSTSSLLCTMPIQQSATLSAGGSGATQWQWFPGGNFGYTLVISPSVTTTYTVYGISSVGCATTAVITQSVSTCASILTGITEIQTLSIFPNPSSGFFTIKAKAGLQIKVYNFIGELILTTELRSDTTAINLNDQASGIYFIRIGSVTKKIVKE